MRFPGPPYSGGPMFQPSDPCTMADHPKDIQFLTLLSGCALESLAEYSAEIPHTKAIH